MLRFARHCLVAVVAIVAWSPVPVAAQMPDDVLSDADVAVYREAFALADEEKWDEAHAAAARAVNPLLAKVLEWQHLTEARSERDFDEISGFMRANPDWPRQYTLQRRAEESMHPSDSWEDFLLWSKGRTMITSDGRMALARALSATGRHDDALPVIRAAWREADFGPQQERQFLDLFKSDLRPEDHAARLDRLLWDRQTSAAKRMLGLVDANRRKLAKARIALVRRRGNVDAAIDAVPKALRDDPGLVYERLRWRRQHELTDSAIELLRHPSVNKGPAGDKWWRERAILARQALQMGYITEAYDIARNHGQTDGVSYVEGEWLAGWIALRFLRGENDVKAAYHHFVKVYEAVSTPISRARGAYWAGRAAEALGDVKLANEWYAEAAPHVTTYYGQLAAGRLGDAYQWPLPHDPLPTAQDMRSFNGKELVKVVRLLDQIDRIDYLNAFIVQLHDTAATPGQRALAAALATAHRRPDLAVWVARRSISDNIPMIVSGYPAPPLTQNEPPEHALALAVIRQESNFNPNAVSHVGARGLMQLMPRTAKKMAAELDLPYSKDKLVEDPLYNITLGSGYIQKQIEEFDGSYILAIAAYNAGPHRVNAWIKEYGDPRDPQVDAVDWIEMIPFSETRNYTQRVLEGLQIYRHKLGRTQLALSLDRDLKR